MSTHKILRKAIEQNALHKVDVIIRSIIATEREVNWTTYKFVEYSDELPLSREAYASLHPKDNYEAYLIEYGPMLSFEEWLSNKQRIVEVAYSEYLNGFDTGITKRDYVIRPSKESLPRAEVFAAEGDYKEYLRAASPMSISEFVKNNPSAATGDTTAQYNQYRNSCPIPKTFMEFYTKDDSGNIKPEIQVLHDEWEEHAASRPKPKSPPDWIRAEGRDSYLYTPTPVSNEDVINYKIANSDLFSNPAINSAAPEDPVRFEKQLKIQELKDEIRKDLGNEIGDVMDSIADLSRLVILFHSIILDIEQDQEVMSDVRTHCKEMLSNYGGGAEIVKTFKRNTRSFQSHVINRFYPAKQEVLACDDIDAIREVQLPVM